MAKVNANPAGGQSLNHAEHGEHGGKRWSESGGARSRLRAKVDHSGDRWVWFGDGKQ